MQRVLGPLIKNEVLVYLDDIFIYAREPERLLEVLANVLRLLKCVNLKCRPKKCELFRTTISFLGHVVSPDGIAPDPHKLDKIRQWPRPTTGTEMASFLGLCNYNCELVPAFAETIDTFYRATRVPVIK